MSFSNQSFSNQSFSNQSFSNQSFSNQSFSNRSNQTPTPTRKRRRIAAIVATAAFGASALVAGTAGTAAASPCLTDLNFAQANGCAPDDGPFQLAETDSSVAVGSWKSRVR